MVRIAERAGCCTIDWTHRRNFFMGSSELFPPRLMSTGEGVASHHSVLTTIYLLPNILSTHPVTTIHQTHLSRLAILQEYRSSVLIATIPET